jgi:hypothetical protein
MNMPLPLAQKNAILKQYNNLISGRSSDNKLRNWFDSLMTLPFGIYKGISLDSIKSKNIKKFLDNLQSVMDKAVYGHDDTKRQIIQMMGQQIRNPKSKGNILGIWGPPGNGKCFALDTPILMYDGSIRKVQDVMVGDVVMGDDSKPRNVLSLGRGVDEMYRIVSIYGDEYVVNSEHILCLKSVGFDRVVKTHDFCGNKIYRVQYLDRKKYKFLTKEYNNIKEAYAYLNHLKNSNDNVMEITVKDYLKLDHLVKMTLRGYKMGVSFNEKKVHDPYRMGIWIGSNMKHNLNIYASNDLNIYTKDDFKSQTNMDDFSSIYSKYNLYENLHIPDDYKINDRHVRLELLAGLVDSTGYCEKKGNVCIVVKTFELCQDVLFLTRSLGFASNYYDLGNNYHIRIFGNMIDMIPTKHTNILPMKSGNDIVYKFEVIPCGKDNYYGFTIDGNNRFLLGDFSVTHNTTIIKEGIAKGMEKPFVFISLGGATDSSFLEGHSYTYEGSIYGRIVNGLITSKCMDPIIYFDELDKISKTTKGDEITNILVHLTNSAQNSHFRDKYFHGIDIDLSRVTMIFSFNDPSKVNPILLDRITTIETKYLLTSQKIHIAKNYLLPDMLKDVGLKETDVVVNNEILTNLIDNYTFEGGVRKLKSLLYNIVREINLSNLLNTKIDNMEVRFPFEVKDEHIKIFLKNKVKVDPSKINDEAKVGVINGLYAGSLGIGGILPIQILWIPTEVPLKLKATGYLQKVIRESTEVACTLAWNHLDEDLKNKYMKEWKDRPMGFHIHCGEGAIPKDGPSAGAALTIAIYSMLTNRKIRNDLAMTGEINLEGKVTAIGGLEEKLEGFKKAGVRLALIPKENENI